MERRGAEGSVCVCVCVCVWVGAKLKEYGSDCETGKGWGKNTKKDQTEHEQALPVPACI